MSVIFTNKIEQYDHCLDGIKLLLVLFQTKTTNFKFTIDEFNYNILYLACECYMSLIFE